ncbi:MAG: hypothetical protein JOZ24_12750, partial [Candidatus Eremiobacteraeota bacterium]|nr:hypothetical protein [Candidatus Eremiobacteraeota bacterium]
RTPVDIEPPPAYLSDSVPHVEREAVLAAILAAMDRLFDALGEPLRVADAWQGRAALRGRRYRVRLHADGTVVEGTALRLDQGALVIAADDGGERTVHLADARVF